MVMAEDNVFDRLVTQLSTDERKELLSKMRGEVYVPDIPSAVDDEADDGGSVDYGTPGFLERLLLFFVALFSGKPQHEVRETMVFRKAARDLENKYPGVVDFSRTVLLKGFKEALMEIASGFSIFSEPLQQITGGTKDEFYAFLGGLEMPDLQAEIQAALEPLEKTDTAGTEDPAGLKRDIEFKLEDLLNTVERAEHDKMYLNARQISWLRSMTFFPYSKIISEFESGPEGKGEVCYIGKVIKSLSELADLAASYPAVPAETLYEALITYRFRNDLDKSDFEYEQKLKEFISCSGRALDRFGRFLATIPLVRLIRVYRRDFSYYPRRTTGGEDWFILYRQFWFNRLNSRYNGFVARQELQELMARAASFIRQSGLPPEGLYRSNGWGYGSRVRYERSFAFLTGLHRNVFLLELNPALKIVLIDGEFYKAQNRQEFTDAYNEIARLPEKVKAVEADLSEKGERGRQIHAVAKELIPQQHRAKKIAALLQAVDKDVKEIIESALESFSLLEKVLRGIVYGEKGGRYDTLSNIGYLGKRGNISFIARLSAAHKKTEAVIDIMSSLFDLETAANTEKN